MTEEFVTKSILKWLIENQWKVICFDFPQSGTGKVLHMNTSCTQKNKDSIIPDIVAVKESISIFFENKDRFYQPDYEKVNRLIVDNQYTDAIASLLSEYEIKQIFYGIGLPKCKHQENSERSAHLVNFIIGVNENKTIEILYNPENIAF